MMYLYHGGSHSLKVEAGDVLELMAAANFFQLPGLSNIYKFRGLWGKKIGICQNLRAGAFKEVNFYPWLEKIQAPQSEELMKLEIKYGDITAL